MPLFILIALARVISNQNPDPLFSKAEAAAYLNIAEQTISNWLTTGRYNLPYVRVGRLIRFKKSDLDAFIARRTVGASDGGRE
jgi:excisionase family DNA binding protein